MWRHDRNLETSGKSTKTGPCTILHDVVFKPGFVKLLFWGKFTYNYITTMNFLTNFTITKFCLRLIIQKSSFCCQNSNVYICQRVCVFLVTVRRHTTLRPMQILWFPWPLFIFFPSKCQSRPQYSALVVCLEISSVSCSFSGAFEKQNTFKI
jgi:hypothetical protein